MITIIVSTLHSPLIHSNVLLPTMSWGQGLCLIFIFGLPVLANCLIYCIFNKHWHMNEEAFDLDR
jgi:hypothetical protein